MRDGSAMSPETVEAFEQLAESMFVKPPFRVRDYYAVGFGIARRESLAVSVGSGVALVRAESEAAACERVRQRLLPEYPEKYGWVISLTGVEVTADNSDMRRPSAFSSPPSVNGRTE